MYVFIYLFTYSFIDLILTNSAFHSLNMPTSSFLASTQLVVFRGGGMLLVTPRTPSPPSNTVVETCSGGVFQLRGN